MRYEEAPKTKTLQVFKLEAYHSPVTPLVQNSNSLLEDLRRLTQLNDIKNQTDIAYPKIANPGNTKAKRPSKGVKLKR